MGEAASFELSLPRPKEERRGTCHAMPWTEFQKSFPGTVVQEAEDTLEITWASVLVAQTMRLRAGKGPAWGPPSEQNQV